jgi:hypothetical protein
MPLSAVAGYVCPAGLSLRLLIPETGPVTERLRVRDIDDDEGRQLVLCVPKIPSTALTSRLAIPAA